MKNLVFIGMRGSGKTTLGKAFAEKYGLDFFDTDEEIEKKEGRKISRIVGENGWEYFRKLEREICAESAHLQDTVISVGGGAVMDERNVKALKENGVFIFLWAPLDELEKWLSSPESKRPALTEGKSLREEIRMVWEERRRTYIEVADFILRY